MKETQKAKKSKQQTSEVNEGVLFDESLDIFGEHKTREQVKTEEKIRKKEEREALRAEMKKRRKAAKEGGTPARRKDILSVMVVVVAIVLLCVLALGNSLLRSKEDTQWEIDQSRGYILKEDCNPEISAEGPKADILECYFTQNNHLYLEVGIRNGTDKVLRIDAIDVVVKDNATGDTLAAGKVYLEEELVLEIMDLSYYGFYVSPDHLFVDEDTNIPEVCSFDFLIDSTAIVIE